MFNFYSDTSDDKLYIKLNTTTIMKSNIHTVDEKIN